MTAQDTRALGLASFVVLFEGASDGVLFSSADGTVVAANPAACTLLGRDPADVCGAGLDGPGGLVDDEDPRWSLMRAERHRTGAASGVVRLRRGDRRFAEFEVTLRSFHIEDGSEQSCLLVRDLEGRIAIEREIEELSARLLQLSRVDDLTGFQNRRGLIVAGTHLLERADRQDVAVEILYLDVRNVAELNQRLGHHAGDAALQAVARALSVTFQTHDVLARVAGTIFVVLSLGSPRTGIDALVSCVRTHLDAPDTIAFIGAGVDVAFGSTTRHPGDATSLEDLVTRANRTMLRSSNAPPPADSSYLTK